MNEGGDNLVLAHALTLAAQKVRLFPVVPMDKVPLISNYAKEATSEPDKLKSVFSNHPDYNSGIACGLVTPGLFLVGVDIDFKKGKNGYETLEALDAIGRSFPETWRQKTPSGGEHRLFWSPLPIRQGTSVLGEGIDIRGEGGYLVGPGSRLENGVYNPIEGPGNIAMFPEWAIKLYEKKAPVLSINGGREITVQDQVLALKRGAEYLASLPVVTTGERNDQGYKTICKLKDFGVARGQIIELLFANWRCEPMLSIEELTHLVNSVFTYGASQPGVLAPENLFPDDLTTAPPIVKRDIIDELNDRYLVVNENGKALIYSEGRDEVLKRDVIQRLMFDDFKKLYSNNWIDVQKKNGESKKKSLADAWLEHPRRRQFIHGVTFDPSGNSPKDVYNIWRGWAMKPLAGSFPLLERYLWEILCDSDMVLYEYLLNWLARMFQQPQYAGEVALVFRGKKGIGKSTLAEFLIDMIGQHALELSQPDQLTGRFLAHLRDAVLVVANESFWSGDRRAEGQLKSIITNKYLSLEGKFQAPVTVKNVVHLMFTTNEEWAVPASLDDERRYAVFDVSDKRLGDVTYFAGLRNEAYNRGGLEALLHHLTTRNISEFDVRDFPDNAGLTDQKTRSLRGPEKWLFECLSIGSLGGYNWVGLPLLISKGNLYRAYVDWSVKREYSPTEQSGFIQAIEKHLGECVKSIKASDGERAWEILPLFACRRRFIDHNKLVDVKWMENSP